MCVHRPEEEHKDSVLYIIMYYYLVYIGLQLIICSLFSQVIDFHVLLVLNIKLNKVCAVEHESEVKTDCKPPTRSMSHVFCKFWSLFLKYIGTRLLTIVFNGLVMNRHII